ncbi:histidine phosphatase family protein [Micromonospora sp. CPCC 206060]|uniref:histidine phosphatase family protein n=1 Tax=Micromonospora sp. CPCC 206060 TaxID=3122406 RepID=UPI002FF16719
MAELERLWIVRHGESTGNVAASRAEADGAELIDLTDRDADVTLSPTGREQAVATGRWLAGLPEAERPRIAVVSPYRRAAQTAELALAEAGIPAHRDERLRDRELGILDLHTSHGVRTRFPEEAARRARLGRFYYRPPGGESWADVALRLRALLGDLRRDHADGQVVLFGHETLVLLLRYLIEGLDEVPHTLATV